jgi:hypothetical protein
MFKPIHRWHTQPQGVRFVKAVLSIQYLYKDGVLHPRARVGEENSLYICTNMPPPQDEEGKDRPLYTCPKMAHCTRGERLVKKVLSIPVQRWRTPPQG